LCIDSKKPSNSQAKKVFRIKVVKNKHFSYQLWEGLVVIQVIKSYSKKGKGYLFSGLNKIKIACGEWQQYGQYVKKYQINFANTAYIERHNATLRGHLYCLVRRGRAIRENIKIIENLLWMKLVVYNYATYHRSLTCKDTKKKNTPAMKAGITNTKIKVEDALYFNTVSKKISNFNVHT
jgi:IS1 family transposase